MREELLARLSLRLIRMVQTDETQVEELLKALSKAVKGVDRNEEIEKISDQLVKRMMLKVDRRSPKITPTSSTQDVSGLSALVSKLPIEQAQQRKLDGLVRELIDAELPGERQRLLRDVLDVMREPRLNPVPKSAGGGGIRGWLGKSSASTRDAMEQYTEQLAILLERLCHHIDIVNGNEQESVAFKSQIKTIEGPEAAPSLIEMITREIDEIDRRILAERNQASEFLGDLRKRLTGFENLFTSIGAAGDESMQRAESLQVDVNNEVEGIGKAISGEGSAASPADNSGVVQGGLKEITLKLAGYMAEEKAQHEQTKSALGDLTNKLVELERETDSLRNEILAKENLALRDALTGVYNRAGYDVRLQEMYDRCSRTGAEMSIVFVDCDEFKRINDQFGHHAGDLVLTKVADTLKSRARSSDIVARYGGDEFVVLLADAPLEGATMFAEDVCRKIANAGFNNNGKLLDVSISCGVAQLKHGEDAAGLVKRADDAMYRAKKLSGMRVAVN